MTESSSEKDNNKNNLLLAMLWLQRHREIMSLSQQNDTTTKVSDFREQSRFAHICRDSNSIVEPHGSPALHACFYVALLPFYNVISLVQRGSKKAASPHCQFRMGYRDEKIVSTNIVSRQFNLEFCCSTKTINLTLDCLWGP